MGETDSNRGNAQFVMKIEVKLHGTLRRHRPSDAGGAAHHPFFISIPDGATITQLAAQLSLPEGLLHAAALNGESVLLEAVLRDGDSVQLFPPSAGG
ncbi:MAG: MoaD/ThiS family protein [Ardenticatenaceae bacterium]|nr:MoaD/ThiS family protein [Ardenticatenaceae bacterium]